MMWQAIVREVDCKLEEYANANYSKMIPNVTNLTHSWYNFWDGIMRTWSIEKGISVNGQMNQTNIS